MTLPAEALVAVREGGRLPPAAWNPPDWLLPHQPAAARHVAAALGTFGIALLCDATGLGKTWTALAVATRYRRPVAVVPAILQPQWRRTAARVGVSLSIESHERLSRGGHVPPGDLVLVDEAHRFRNTATVRYDRLARGVGGSAVLLITATPVVNSPTDLAALLLLGLANPPADLSPILFSRSVIEAGVAGMPGVGHTRVRVRRCTDDLRQAIGQLTFPTFGRVGVVLLRRHLLYRLGSSLPAAVETLRRHDRYLEQLERNPMSRSGFRRRIDPDDPQIELVLCERPASRPEVIVERARIASLLHALGSRRDAKVERLRELVTGRPGRTVIFTCATASARAIARALGWRRLALVTGTGARIASGPVSVARALDAFAPVARSVRVAEAERADVLVATDLASEGLDLQDAETVVHFDLPWTPQRLMQRLGRVARLGSAHDRVEVAWFPPPPALDIPERLTRKERALRLVLETKRLPPSCRPADTVRPLVRSLLRHARDAARTRNVALIEQLDGVLHSMRGGLVAGAERDLRDLLSGDPTTRGVRHWLERWTRVPPRLRS